MPVQGIVENGVNYTFEEYMVLAENGKAKLPFTLASALVPKMQKKHSFPYPSIISSCPRKVAIEHTNNFYASFGTILYSFRGTLLHELLRQAQKAGMKETLVKIDTGKYQINGVVDYYNAETREVRDYKTQKAFHYIKNEIDETYLRKPAFFMQCCLYALGLKQQGIMIDHGVLEYYCFEINDGKPWNYEVEFDINDEKIEQTVEVFNNHVDKIKLGIEDIGQVTRSGCKDFGYLCRDYCDVKDICKILPGGE